MLLGDVMSLSYGAMINGEEGPRMEEIEEEP
jgi:hypothetical protein